MVIERRMLVKPGNPIKRCLGTSFLLPSTTHSFIKISAILYFDACLTSVAKNILGNGCSTKFAVIDICHTFSDPPNVLFVHLGGKRGKKPLLLCD